MLPCARCESPGRYASVITRSPWIIILLTLIAVCWAGLNGFIKELGAKPYPNFALPAKGFEPRDTLISRRIVAHNNLEKTIFGLPPLTTSSRRPDPSSYSFKKSPSQVCSLDPRAYLSAKTIYARQDGRTILTAESLRAVCQQENKIIRDNEFFKDSCVRPSNASLDCCPSLSVGVYVAILNNRSSCENIRDEDVAAFSKLLQTCKKYIVDGRLHERCLFLPSTCPSVPQQCLAWNIPLLVFNYMGDKEFASPLANHTELTYTIAFSPLRQPSKALLQKIYEDSFRELNRKRGSGEVKIVAYEFTGLKNLIYDTRLLVDIWYVMSAMILVIFLMWIYSASLFLSLMGFATVVFALTLSYWIYTIVFQLRFFPFLNLMTAIFIVGIGADDVFVYVLAWRHAKQKIPMSGLEYRPRIQTLTCWTEYALEHAAAAMFVTSLTTATAFYAGVSSNITALQCFSIFAGTSIMTNYLLMLTWFPSMMIVHQRFLTPMWCIHPHIADGLPGIALAKRTTVKVAWARGLVIRFREKMKGISDTIFGYWIANLVVRLRYLWVVLFLVLAIFGVICMTVYPKLQLPTSQTFPLFVKSHSLEQYDFKIKEKLQIDISLGSERADFPIIFVWGVKDQDKGYFLDPDDTGSSVWDSSFDVINEESQRWSVSFCKALKNQSFYRSGECFMEELHKLSVRNCSQVYPSKCCQLTPPLKRQDFQTCSREYVNLHAKQGELSPIKMDFEGNIRLMVLRFRSTCTYQFKFAPVDSFWNSVRTWTDSQLSNAPSGLRNGWVVSDLYFYDLQQSLASGTIKTIGISVGISAMVLLITTQNVIVTLLAVLTISGVIAVTIGSLVLSGWKLNILESMTMSVAVGLSIDFTLHYGVAYFLCKDSKKRKDRVHYSLWHVGSAVAMGTVTTFLAGLVMMPSVIYAYIQVGHFLMLVMSISWFYATFFFLSLTSVLGPQGRVGDIIKCWSKKEEEKEVEEIAEEFSEESVYLDAKELKRRRHKSRFFEYEQPDPERLARARSSHARAIYVDGLLLFDSAVSTERRPRSMTEVAVQQMNASMTRTLSVPNSRLRGAASLKEVEYNQKSNSRTKLNGRKNQVSFVNVGLENDFDGVVHLYDTVPKDRGYSTTSLSGEGRFSKCEENSTSHLDYDVPVKESNESPPPVPKHGTLTPQDALELRLPADDSTLAPDSEKENNNDGREKIVHNESSLGGEQDASGHN